MTRELTPEGKQEGKEETAVSKCSSDAGVQGTTLLLPVQNEETNITEVNDAVAPNADENHSYVKAQSLNTTVATKEQTEPMPAADINRDRRRVHSAFGKHQKQFIVVMVTLASFFSPLSGQIYYPVMPTLVKSYHLTTALVNLSVTTYMILQGLAPSFIGTFADAGGRRPAYIISFAIYTAANIGLALQNSFAALLVLRCLQSAGSSGTISFGYGVIADIATSAERGKYIGPMSAGVMVAPALGPVIGGILSKFLGWRSVFWFLVIISGSYLVLFVIAMPETARRIVGDGRYPPKELWRMSLLQYLAQRKSRQAATAYPAGHEQPQSSRRTDSDPRSAPKLKFPNPFKSFVILLEKDALIIVSYVGLVMFANIALLTSTPNLFGKLYGFNELQIGLCFLQVHSSVDLSSDGFPPLLPIYSSQANIFLQPGP